jgi:hypothetical protein
MPVVWLKHRLGDVMAESVIQMQVILQVHALSVCILYTTHRVHLHGNHTSVAAKTADVMYSAFIDRLHCTCILSWR